MDRMFAQVLRNFGARIIGSKRLLVDIFLEDIAEHVRADFVVTASRRVVEIPGVASEQPEQVLKCQVGNTNVRVALLNRVFQKKPAVEVNDRTE